MSLPAFLRKKFDDMIAISEVPLRYSDEECAAEQDRYEQGILAQRDKDIAQAIAEAHDRITCGMLPSEACALMQQRLNAIPAKNQPRIADLDMRD